MSYRDTREVLKYACRAAKLFGAELLQRFIQSLETTFAGSSSDHHPHAPHGRRQDVLQPVKRENPDLSKTTLCSSLQSLIWEA